MTETDKVKIPDGKGGWREVDAVKYPGSKQDLGKAEKALAERKAKDYFERIGHMSEALNRFINNWGRESGYEPEEIAGAVFLESCNIRTHYPDGGPDAYDDICRVVAEWYKQHA